MLYLHHSQVPWDRKRWPNFKPSERNLHCPCCGEFFLDPVSMDKLQTVRTNLKRSIKINSGHRCFLRNHLVGGKPMSVHKRIAFDIDLYNHDIEELLHFCKTVDFQGFGYYGTFLHVDNGRRRWWITKSGKKRWNGLIKY